MATAGSMMTSIRKILGDPNGDFANDNTIYDWLNRGQGQFCQNVLALDEIHDYPIVAKQSRYDLPSTCIIPIWIQWYQSRVAKLEYTPPNLWARVEERNPSATGTPDRYTVIRNQLLLGPQVPTTSSKTHLGSGAMTTANTTISLATTPIFRSKGFIKVDSEVIEYTALATTTMTGCARGLHGTTAATHASGVTVTQIDLQMLYRRTPAVIAATSTVPDIPLVYHDHLEMYALYLGWLARGDSEKAKAAFELVTQGEKDAKKIVGRRSMDGLLKIQERKHSWYGW